MKKRFVMVGGCLWAVFSLVFACSAPPDGQKVYLESGCTRCHELNGSGGSQGPRLEGLITKWTAESLDQFLADPPAFVKENTRLQAYQDDYITPMPKLVIEPAKRKALVEYLLKTHP